MEYSFQVKISLDKPIVRNYVQYVVEQSLKETDFSAIVGEKMQPSSIEVTQRK